jgi:hypothetical protein
MFSEILFLVSYAILALSTLIAQAQAPRQHAAPVRAAMVPSLAGSLPARRAD